MQLSYFFITAMIVSLLLFSGPEHDLTGWRTLDSAGNLTQVGMHDVKTGKKLNPRLFIVKDFDDE